MIFEVPDPDFERRVRTSFARQGLNATIRATLRRVAPGQVEIEVPFSGGVSQQHGFFHGGVMGAIGDSACGYAAMTLTLPSSEVLTIEYEPMRAWPAFSRSLTKHLLATGSAARASPRLPSCSSAAHRTTCNSSSSRANKVGTLSL